MSDAYEQIHVKPNDVPRMTFSTPQGMYNSNTMQQGDCNAPCTFQRALTWELRGEVSWRLHIWFDDIFTSTSSVENHNTALLWLYNRLKQAKFYISRKKYQPFALVLDILGSCMDEQGIHMQLDKMEKIRNWQEPVDHTGVLRFLGLIKYLLIFMLNVGSYTGLLQTVRAM